MSGFLDKAKAKLDEVMDNTTLDEKAQDTYAQHGDKVEGAIDQHADRIDQGIDQAGTFIDDRTGGRFGEQIDAGGDQLRERLDELSHGQFATAAHEPRGQRLEPVDVVALDGLLARIPHLGIREGHEPPVLLPPANLDAEADLLGARLERALEYGRAAGLNRVVHEPPRPRIALVAAGVAFAATLRALDDLWEYDPAADAWRVLSMATTLAAAASSLAATMAPREKPPPPPEPSKILDVVPEIPREDLSSLADALLAPSEASSLADPMLSQAPSPSAAVVHNEL